MIHPHPPLLTDAPRALAPRARHALRGGCVGRPRPRVVVLGRPLLPQLHHLHAAGPAVALCNHAVHVHQRVRDGRDERGAQRRPVVQLWFDLLRGYLLPPDAREPFLLRRVDVRLVRVHVVHVLAGVLGHLVFPHDAQVRGRPSILHPLHLHGGFKRAVQRGHHPAPLPAQRQPHRVWHRRVLLEQRRDHRRVRRIFRHTPGFQCGQPGQFVRQTQPAPEHGRHSHN